MGRIPSTWTVATIGSVCIETEQVIPESDMEFTYVDIGSVDRFKKKVATPQRLLGKDAPSRARKLIRTGDTIVSTTRPNLNAVALIDPTLNGQIASTGFEVLRAPGLDPRWLSYLVRTSGFVDAMTSLVQGALYPAVRGKDVRSFQAPIAPRNEQKRIADKLDTVLTRLDAVNARLAGVTVLLKRFRQSVLVAATSGQLTEDWRRLNADEAVHSRWYERYSKNGPTPETKSFNVPATWRVLHAQDVVEADSNIVYGIVQPGPKLISGIPYVQTTDIVDGRIQVDSLCRTSVDIASRYHRSSIKGGDVLLGIIRATKVAVVPDELSGGNISRSVARLRPCSDIVPQFLAIALESPAVQEWLRAQHRGMDMPVLNLAQVRLAPLPIAPIEEQREIVRRVETLFAFADRLEARLRTARTATERLTPALLAKAFCGELVPQDPNDEPASELLRRLQQEAPPTSTRRGRKSAA